MKTTVTTISCDVCKNNDSQNSCKELELHVVFTTEQTEGRSSPPYLSKVKLDICENCRHRLLVNGEMIFASGAQGHNTYNFKRNNVG